LGAAACLIGWVTFRAPRPSTGVRIDENAAVVFREARFERAHPTHWRLSEGRLGVSAWAAPVTVEAAGRLVHIESALALLEVAADELHVRNLGGFVTVDGEPVARTEGRSEAEAVLEQQLRTVEPPHARQQRLDALLAQATSAKNWPLALETLRALEQESPLRAEAALLRRATLELHELKEPEVALRTLEQLETQFPNGSLVAERELSALEAEWALGRVDAVHRRALRFASTFPDNERRDEVLLLSIRSQRERNQLSEACEAVRHLRDGSGFVELCRGRKGP
jgi:hypothetical protein